MNTQTGQLPPAEGLYDPEFEHDACGVGFVANIKGVKSHDIIVKGLKVLENLAHRGATGCDPETGDGAGILLQIPHDFFVAQLAAQNVRLPAPGEYGVGMLFLPQIMTERAEYEAAFESVIKEEGQILLAWRNVPVVRENIGELARSVEPVIRQIFIGRGANCPDADSFERKLYIIRRRVQNIVAKLGREQEGFFYVSSLSCRTIIYKGLLMADQIAPYYQDLRDPAAVTAIALVHQRFSTNTFPTWDLAHPFRYIAHNGEINTVRGNRNWMRAREKGMTSGIFGEDLPKLFPLVNKSGSDSAALDNAVELLFLSGRSLAHTMMMLIPEAWGRDAQMDADKRAFYEYHACMMEPWDGPAAVAFTDGIQIGAVLDRNGLRPARYLITDDDLVIAASETGVLDIAPEKVVQKGRLQPGRIFLIDTAQGRIISDEEIKKQVCAQKPYAQWLAENRIILDEIETPQIAEAPSYGDTHSGEDDALAAVELAPHTTDSAALLTRQQIFGYTLEDARILLQPMARGGEQPLGSMGTDTPLAALSNRPQLLYNYFKQLFAQVTNPPIDPIREELVMSLSDYIGRDGNLLSEEPEHCRQLRIDSPVLTNADLEKIVNFKTHDLKATRLPMWFFAEDGPDALKNALDKLCAAASQALKDGYSFLILSDRNVDADTVPIPALLAMGAVHHHLVREGTRTQTGLIIESGEVAGSDALCAAHRLRRERGKSLPCLRDASRLRKSGTFAARRDGGESGEEFHQGRQQGASQDVRENGDFYPAIVSRGANFRSDRTGAGSH